MFQIFVCSRGRSGSAKFLQRCNKDGVPAIVLVEPQEVKLYQQAFPKLEIINIGRNNMGISYTRKFAKDMATENGLPAIWIMDDDVTNFYRREGTKLVPEDMVTVLEAAEKQFASAAIALGSLEYRQFAWSATKPLIIDSYVECTYFININLTKPINFRPELPGKDFRDLAMQVIKMGEHTARTTLYAFSAPPCGSNTGGQKEIFYDTEKQHNACQMMVDIWGSHLVKIIDKGKGSVPHDIKIAWDKITSPQGSLF